MALAKGVEEGGGWPRATRSPGGSPRAERRAPSASNSTTRLAAAPKEKRPAPGRGPWEIRCGRGLLPRVRDLRVGGGEAGDRHAARAATHVVHADHVADHAGESGPWPWPRGSKRAGAGLGPPALPAGRRGRSVALRPRATPPPDLPPPRKRNGPRQGAGRGRSEAIAGYFRGCVICAWAAARRAIGTRNGRAAHVVHAHVVAELDAVRLAAVLAADADLELRPGGAALLDADLDQLADAVPVERLERVGRQDAAGRGSRAGSRRCRRGVKPKLICVRSLVPKREELGRLGHLVGGQRGARDLDHRAVRGASIFSTPYLAHTSAWTCCRGRSGRRARLHVAGHRDHDLGEALLALLAQLGGRLEDRADLHLGDLRDR